MELRYLKRVVVWHAAVDALFSSKVRPELLKNIDICTLVLLRYCSPSSLMAREEITDEFFVQFPA